MSRFDKIPKPQVSPMDQRIRVFFNKPDSSNYQSVTIFVTHEGLIYYAWISGYDVREAEEKRQQYNRNRFYA